MLVDSESRGAIQRALEALGREEPDLWDDPTMAHLARRDPEPIRAARVEVIEAAEKLRNHPLLGVPHCGHYVAFLALAPFSTGVLVIPGPQRRPREERVGGIEDLFVVDDPSDSRGLFPLMDRLAAPDSPVYPSYREIPLFAGAPCSRDAWDFFKRLTFRCPTCDAERPVKNVTLLRYFFEAVLRRENDVRLFRSSSGKKASTLRPRTSTSVGAPFEFVGLDEADAILLDAVTVGVGSGPIDPRVPNAVLAGTHAARTASACGCSELAIWLAKSAVRSAALEISEQQWLKQNIDSLREIPDSDFHDAVADLRRLSLWPWDPSGRVDQPS